MFPVLVWFCSHLLRYVGIWVCVNGKDLSRLRQDFRWSRVTRLDPWAAPWPIQGIIRSHRGSPYLQWAVFSRDFIHGVRSACQIIPWIMFTANILYILGTEELMGLCQPCKDLRLSIGPVSDPLIPPSLSSSPTLWGSVLSLIPALRGTTGLCVRTSVSFN